MVTHDGKMASDIDFHQLMDESNSQSKDTPPDAKSNKVKFAVRLELVMFHLQFFAFEFSCIFILLIGESDQSAVTSPVSSCQPSVYHSKVGESG